MGAYHMQTIGCVTKKMARMTGVLTERNNAGSETGEPTCTQFMAHLSI